MQPIYIHGRITHAIPSVSSTLPEQAWKQGLHSPSQEMEKVRHFY